MPADGIAHCLGECKHPAVKGLVLLRHGDVVHMVAQALRRSTKGNAFIVADAEGHPPRYMRLPEWLLPADHPLAPDDDTLPDILFVTPSPPNATSLADIPYHQRAGYTVHIVEVKSPYDLAIHDRFAKAAKQHSALCDYLKQTLGWNVRSHALVIGATGITPVNTLTTLTELGFPTLAATTLIKRLHLPAARRSYAAYRTRCYLIATRNLPATTTPDAFRTHNSPQLASHRSLPEHSQSYDNHPTHRRKRQRTQPSCSLFFDPRDSYHDHN
jgi:hypothetical protein